MKQIRKFSFSRLIAAVSGIALFMGSLAGCTRDDIAEGTLGNGVGGPIKFLVADTPALTKSDGTPIVEHLGSQFFDVVDGDSLYLNLESTPWAVDMASTKVTPYKNKSELTGSSFGFAAYKQDADDSAVNTWTLHGGPIEAPYNGTYWEPTTTILWPNLGKKVHFFAYAPYDAALTMTAANATEPTLSGFQVASGYAQQKDLLWANNVTADSNPLILNGGGAMEAYKLTFRHALAAIRFKVIESANITVNSVTVRGVYDGGTLNMHTGEWTSLSGDGSFSVTNPTTTNDGNGYDVFDEEYTLLLLPNVSGAGNFYTPFLNAEIEVRYTKDGVAKSIITDISNHQWRAGYSLTYAIGDFVANPLYDYFFEVAEQPWLDYTGKHAENGKVVSYKQLKSTSTPNTNPKIPVGWIIEGYYTTLTGARNADPSKRISNGLAGTFVYSFAPESGSGSVDGEQLIVAHPGAPAQNIRRVQNGLAMDAAIAAEPEKGTQTNPWNLSNPTGGDDIVETANTYIINGKGWYRFPIVMGNGVKNNAPNPTALKPNFLNYMDQPIIDPYLRGLADGQKAPAAAYVVWEDKPTAEKIIDIVNPSSPYYGQQVFSETDIEGWYINYPGVTNGIKSTGSGEDIVYWVYFRVAEATKQGIAHIAVRDTDGVEMWSWLIWLTSYVPNSTEDVEAQYLTHTLEPSQGISTLTFMPYPIGWVDDGLLERVDYPRAEAYVRLVQVEGISSTVVRLVRPAAKDIELVNNLGHAPFYQWGRSTPIRFTTNKNGMPQDLRDADLFGGYYRSLRLLAAPVSIGKALQNSSAIIVAPEGGDWCSLNLGNKRNLWSAENVDHFALNRFTDNKVVKTIYDPSPAGYTVPRFNAFTGFVIGAHYEQDPDTEIYGAPGEYISKADYYSTRKGQSLFTNYREDASVTGTGFLYLPALGNRAGASALNINAFSAGRYWTAVPYTSNSARCLDSRASIFRPQATANRSNAYSIFPQKEE